MMQRTCKKFTQLILFTLLATFLLTGCSASQQYAGSKKDGAFFAIPNGWFQITNEELNKEEAKSTNQDDLDRLSLVTYQVGFSPGKKVTPEQVFLLDPTPHPVVFARFRDLFPEERNSISLNALRTSSCRLPTFLMELSKIPATSN